MARRHHSALFLVLELAGACTKKPATTDGAEANSATLDARSSAPVTAARELGAASPIAYDWKPAFAAAFIHRDDLRAPTKTRTLTADEASNLAQSSPSLRMTAPGAGYADAQKGHCLVAAMIQQNLEATANYYTLGGSIAVGTCSVKLKALAVPVKSGSVRFFRALACPGGKFDDVVKDKPTWARFRQTPELARCGDAKAVYFSEQVEATLIVAKQKGVEEQTYKYLSGRVGADGGPCVGTITEGRVRYQNCVDFERLESAKAVDFVSATFADEERAVDGKDVRFAAAAATLLVDDWVGTLTAAPKTETRLHLQRGTDKVDTTLGERPTDDTSAAAVRGVLRALRRNLQTDAASESAVPVVSTPR